nr:Wzz/FepE/Etk N-terminal domain-containing protein [uncultured Blautia sp.]
MNKELTNDEVEIDLVDLGYALLDKWRYLLICLLTGAILMGAYSYFGIAPTYQSTAKLYVVSASDDSVVNLSDLNLGTSLTADYEQLMLSYPVLNRVIDRLNLDTTSDELAKAYSLNNPGDTRILEITATSTDPQMAQDLAETMAEEAIDYLPETMSTLAPNLAQHAKLPESKVAPSYSKYTLIGAFLGFLLCAAFFVVKYLMDDTIHSTDDMEKYFGLVPLTTIPDSEQVIDLDEGEHRRRGRKRGHRK